MDNQEKLKAARGDVQRRFDEICRLILDGEKNLCQLSVKAVRLGMSGEKVDEIVIALGAVIDDFEATFEAAIAQPEPKVAPKSRVNLSQE